MLKLLTLNNIGSQGVNQDITKVQLPPEVITDGNNYRLVSGSVETFGGEVVVGRLATNIYAGNLFYMATEAGRYYILLGRDEVVATDGLVEEILSSVEGYAALNAGDEFLWSWTMIGGIPVINNPQHYPEYWSPQETTTPFAALEFSSGTTWSEASKSFGVIRSHKNFLFALNLYESGTSMPTSFRWSHPADVNGLPYTWDETDLAAIAGISSLPGSSGKIIDALSLRDSFVIYSEYGIYILDYVGGEFIWEVRELTSSYGLLSVDCVVEANGYHYFISDGDILRNDGNSITSILHNRLRKRIQKSLSNEYSKYAFAFSSITDKEVWFCLVEEGFTLPNSAIIYNWADDTISLRSFNVPISKIISAPILQDLSKSLTPKWNDMSTEDWQEFGEGAWAFGGEANTLTGNLIWSGIGQSFADYSKNWDYSGTSPFSFSIVGINPTDSSIIAIEYADYSDNLDTYIIREGFVIGDQRSSKTITAVYPHMKRGYTVAIQVGSQKYAGDPVLWEPEIIFDPRADRKIELRSTGTLHAWKVRSIDNNAFTFSGMDIEYYEGGLR